MESIESNVDCVDNFELIESLRGERFDVVNDRPIARLRMAVAVVAGRVCRQLAVSTLAIKALLAREVPYPLESGPYHYILRDSP